MLPGTNKVLLFQNNILKSLNAVQLRKVTIQMTVVIFNEKKMNKNPNQQKFLAYTEFSPSNFSNYLDSFICILTKFKDTI